MEKGQKVDVSKSSPEGAATNAPSTLKVHANPSSNIQQNMQSAASQPPPPPQPSYNYNGASNNVSPASGTPGSNQNTPNNPKPTTGSRGLSYAEKSIVEAYLLAVSPLGVLGAHHFYLRRYYWGIVYFFTFGLMGCGYLIDWFRVPYLVKEANLKQAGHIPKDERTVSDAYTMWFPFGLLGFHHYYLGNYAWGVAYTCTLGLLGIGWLVDIFRMPYLVREANKRQSSMQIMEKSACATVALGLSPLGVLGAHHYYLNRPIWGVVYTFTLGLMGLGWVFDWFRMPLLIIRANKVARGQRIQGLKTVDDAYILWLPFGLVGFHHFYLGRPLWGILYFCTLGIIGLGWLIDIWRIPFLVRDYNERLEAELEHRALTSSQSTTTVIYSTANQGFPNYGMANPAAYTPTQPPAPYPPQAPYNNQQGRYPYGGQQIPQNGQVPYVGPDGYRPPAYNNMGRPQYQPPMCEIAPPPYEPNTPDQVNQPAGPLPGKH